MRAQSISILLLTAIFTGCSSIPKPKPIPAGSLEQFQAKAAKFNSVVTVPRFETTPAEVAATADKTITDGNAALDTIGRLQPSEVNFTNTVRALDDANYESDSAANRLGLIEQTSTNAGCTRCRHRCHQETLRVVRGH